MRRFRNMAVCLLIFAWMFSCVQVPKASYAQPEDALVKGLQTGLDKTIFLDLRDINVIDILKFLAIQGDLNIVTSKNVQGRSTLVLRNVRIRDAIDIIVISNQLAYEFKHNIIYIMTEDEYVQIYGKPYNDKRRITTRGLKYAKPSYIMTALQAVQSNVGKIIVDDETGTVVMIDTPEKLNQMNALIDDMERKLDTQVVSLQYANAKDVEAQLKLQVEPKAVGTVFADERSNQIIISAYPERMDEILKLIKSLDKNSLGILLEVRIMQLTLSPKFNFGIDWEVAFKDKPGPAWLKTLDFKGAFPIDSTINTTGTFGKIAVGDVTATDFQAATQALKQVIATKVLANPRLMVLNRQEAKINIGDRIPYVITTTTGTGNNTSVSEEIKFIDVGLSLLVTPLINDNGFITMKIRPEISSQTGTLETPTKNKIPLVNTTFVESTVMVRDGYTVILGGLRRDDFKETDKGLPYLMDIPLIGNAFKNRSEETIRTEVVIIMTPKIVSGANQVIDEPFALKQMPARGMQGELPAGYAKSRAATDKDFQNRKRSKSDQTESFVTMS